jgi:SOS-response transcriptional repressor LexA
LKPLSLPLTARQRDVLNAIRESSAKGRAPTLEELCDLVGMRSTNAVRNHLVALQRKGFLKPRTKNKQRDIHLIAEKVAA